ncbi:MAG: LamG-like jellyroll fold domain-containing protein, partial [Verrucomicrobiales bacterium]
MMRNFSRPLLLVAALVPFLSASISPAALIHRYSFNSPAGDATDAVLTDSVGSADGVVLGSGALFTGSALDLPGGSSDTAAYGDLPNNLISPLTELTIEGWITIDGGVNNWGRIFDFGSTEPGGSVDGEVTGPGNTNGGGTAGLDYFILTASRGADYDVQRIEVRNEDPAGGGITTIDSGVGTIFGQQFHYAVTWRDTGPGTSEISYWRDGVKLTDSAVVGSNIGDVNDVNNWLGRSTWLNDGNTDATYDEFRIYDTALDDTQISDSRAAGPNAVIAPPGDSDADGIPDEYEDRYPFLNPMDPSDAPLDEDTDGLSNLGEYEEKTKPDVADSDEDG